MLIWDHMRFEMTRTINMLQRRSRWICRCASWGITSYDLDPTSGRIIFPAGGSLFFCADPATGHTGRNQIRDWLNHSHSHFLVAFVFFCFVDICLFRAVVPVRDQDEDVRSSFERHDVPPQSWPHCLCQQRRHLGNKRLALFMTQAE